MRPSHPRYRGNKRGDGDHDHHGPTKGSPGRGRAPALTPGERLILLLFLITILVVTGFWYSMSQKQPETLLGKDAAGDSARGKINKGPKHHLHGSDVNKDEQIPTPEADTAVDLGSPDAKLGADDHKRLASAHPSHHEQSVALHDLLARVLGRGAKEHIHFNILLPLDDENTEGRQIEGAGGGDQSVQDLDEMQKQFEDGEKSGGDFYNKNEDFDHEPKKNGAGTDYYGFKKPAGAAAGLGDEDVEGVEDVDKQKKKDGSPGDATTNEYYRFRHHDNNKKLVVIEASTPSAATFGLHQLMKEWFNVSVTWGVGQTGGTHLDQAVSLLADPEYHWPPAMLDARHHQRRVAVAHYRYYYNVCTFGYSTPFWDWPEWEKEIDWMALRGINLPLAFIGQEHIWMKLWTENYHIPKKEVLQDFFTGPAFFAWHWMGNLKKWAGPVDATWIERRRQLQHKIVRRMRLLGIKPVFPAFAGHIPAALTDHFPDLQVQYSSKWMGFNSTFSGMALLDPLDPKFVEIGTRFMQLQTAEYGVTDFYNGDTFNEMMPQSYEPKYLMSASRSVVLGIKGGNPNGKWLVQGWLFLHHRQFWNPRNVYAYLSGAKNNVMILDLAGDIQEVWRWHRGFEGTPFVWCMLHSFGGRRGVFGNVEQTARTMIAALTQGGPGIRGIGLTMEATQHNPVVYEAVTDLFFLPEAWIDRPSFAARPNGLPSGDTLAFIGTYQVSRYGGLTFGAGHVGDNAWNGVFQGFSKLFYHGGPYAHRVTCCPTWSLMSGMPSTEPHHELDKEYNPDYLWLGTTEMFSAIQAYVDANRKTPGFIHPFDASPPLLSDMVDLFRQMMENFFVEHVLLLEGLMKHYRRFVAVMSSQSPKDTLKVFDALTKTMHQMFPDMDDLLSVSDDYNLEEIWLKPAARWATPTGTGGESGDEMRGDLHVPDRLTVSRMLFNAKNLITLWGNGVQGYPNYAAKAWSGLYEEVYLLRWQTYHAKVRELYVRKQYGFKAEHVQTEMLHNDYLWCLHVPNATAIDSGVLSGMTSYYALAGTKVKPPPARKIIKPSALKQAPTSANGKKIPPNRNTPGWKAMRLMTRLMHSYVSISPDEASGDEALGDVPLRNVLWHKNPQMAEIICKRYGELRFMKKWCTPQGGNDMPRL